MISIFFILIIRKKIRIFFLVTYLTSQGCNRYVELEPTKRLPWIFLYNFLPEIFECGKSIFLNIGSRCWINRLLKAAESSIS